jgi:hypothetical protein
VVASAIMATSIRRGAISTPFTLSSPIEHQASAEINTILFLLIVRG